MVSNEFWKMLCDVYDQTWNDIYGLNPRLSVEKSERLHKEWSQFLASWDMTEEEFNYELHRRLGARWGNELVWDKKVE